MTSCESTSGISTFASKSIPESLKCRELPPPPAEGDASESAILLKQLFTGELMDAYNEFLSAYPHAKALLRRKARRDEHFTALADIRRGAAKYTIADYLQLPVSHKFTNILETIRAAYTHITSYKCIVSNCESKCGIMFLHCS